MVSGNGVDILAGWLRLIWPAFRRPTVPDNRLRSRSLVGPILYSAQEFGFGIRASEIELSERHSTAEQVGVAIDEARQNDFPFSIDSPRLRANVAHILRTYVGKPAVINRDEVARGSASTGPNDGVFNHEVRRRNHEGRKNR